MLIYISATTRLVLLSTALLPVHTETEIWFRWRIADAIASVTDDEHEQNVLMSIVRWETNYIERLASPNCECRGKECDNGRAKGSWQIIPYNKEEATKLCVSLEMDAKIALHRIRESEVACKNLPKEERLSVYARGKCESLEGRRLSRVRWIK